MKLMKKAFVLGAGYGMRMRPLTLHQPKPTLKLFVRPIIEYIFDFLEALGIEEIVINTHHHAHVYHELYGERTPQGQHIKWIHEPVLLNTGGGLKNVEAEFSDGPFLMVNGDVLYEGSLDKALEFHQKNQAIATMLLSPYHGPKHVAVNRKGEVQDIRGLLDRPADFNYTFCGIHILEPDIFEFIQPHFPISIIRVYLEMIRKNQLVHGYLWDEGKWLDVGILGLYRFLEDGCCIKGAPSYFGKKTFPARSKKPLYGLGEKGTILQFLPSDGSDHVYYRMVYEGDTRLAMFYGEEREENAKFVEITKFFNDLRINVPKIYYHDIENRTVVLEDLGSNRLYDVFKDLNSQQRFKIYKDVIDQILRLHLNGLDHLRNLPFQISIPFNRDYYLWESDYFKKNYLFRHCRFEDSAKEEEFDCLSRQLAVELARESMILIHRDFQSKNIMLKSSEPYLIDYQGMRLGLAQYDLASLLMDPYVALDQDLRQSLIDYYFEHAKSLFNHYESFMRIYDRAVIQRLMQAMGAFCYLAYEKGKHYFLDYLPRAEEQMKFAFKKINQSCFWLSPD